MKMLFRSFSGMLFLTISAAGLSAFAAGQTESSPKNPAPFLAIEVDKPILVMGTGKDGLPSANLRAKAFNFPQGAALKYKWEQIQDVLSPIAAKMDEGKKIAMEGAATPNVTATFPAWGVYEIKATVLDVQRGTSVTRNTWINVWDNKSLLVVNGKEDPLGVAPGTTPPPSVRNLSPDPGPFQHPRLYCTNQDWADIKKRCTTGVIAAIGYKNLQDGLVRKGQGMDSPTSSKFAKLTADLEAFADSHYSAGAPDLTCGIASETKEGKANWDKARQNLSEYHQQLRDACLLAWLKNDPALPHAQIPAEDQARCRKLAKVIAALTHLHLGNSWDRETGEFKKNNPLYIPRLHEIGEGLQEFQHITLAFDFIASWMTPEEQRKTRDFLFAVGVARATGARWFIPVVNKVWINRSVERGTQQNGDFMNIEEEKILPGLCLAGEESGVDPKVVETFTSPAKPKDYENSGKSYPYEWVHYTDKDSGRDLPGSKPYPEGGNWPHARKVQVDNLQRAIWWNDDWYVSPWGFELNREAYYGFSAWGLWPAAVAYARHGAFNQFVAANYYHTAIHHLYEYYPGLALQKGKNYSSNIYMYDHHDGGLDYRQTHAVLMKYMYPDDPMVDYVYGPYAVAIEQRSMSSFLTAIFGVDPGVNGKPATLPEVGKEKALPLTKLDPQIGLVVARSGWKEDDMALLFDAGWPPTGHMHAEKNSFAFFALGRSWAISPGYHQKLNNFYSTIMVQDPTCSTCTATQGYVGQSESAEPAGSDYPTCHPTPPGRLVEVTESPDKLCTLMVGDAKTAYDYCYAGNKGKPQITPPWTRAEHMYPGMLDVLLKRLPDPLNKEFFTGKHNNVGWDEKINPGYNPVQYAFRTILFVRGAHPYVLIVDDFKKENAPRNYRWMMNNCYSFGPPDGKATDENGKIVRYSMIMAPGATPTEATLLHLPDKGDQPGLPRLLVRDLSEAGNQSQPAMRMDNTKYMGSDTNRIFIDRNNVVEPNYKVLLYPYRTGEKLPVTSWGKNTNALTITHGDGAVDTIRFDRSNPDHRTRVKHERRKD